MQCLRWMWTIAVLLAVGCAHAATPSSNKGEVELSREGKASIEMALQYLAARQRSDGSFSGELGQGTGVVAAAALAWMVNGNLPGEGPYGKNVARAIDYILNCAQPTGLLFKGQDKHVMYHHGLAAICLAEAWGHSRDKRLHDRLKKAIDLIVRTQSDNGGWRYHPRPGDHDLSATVMQLLALRAAKDAGIPVPRDTIERAIGYVELCRDARNKEKDGFVGFAYQPDGQKKWSTTAAGLMSLMLAGDYKASSLKDGLQYLKSVREKKEDRDWFIYGHYYAAQAMYRAGADEKFRDLWLSWYPDISKSIMQTQRTSGQDRGRYDNKQSYGVWGTAMCVLILGIPYRYLPIYQR